MKFLTLSFLLFAGSWSTVYAQDTKSQGVLDKLSIKMKALKSFYLEFNAVIKNTASGINENQNGKGWVKGNKYNATYAGNTIISNGMKTWTIIKEDKTVYESDSNDDNDAINPKKIMTIWETGFKNKYVKEELLNAETVHVINLTPKNPAKSDFTNITIYISKASNAMKKAVINSKDGTIMTYTVSKFESNPDVKDTKFVFEKKNYPGYPVIKD